MSGIDETEAQEEAAAALERARREAQEAALEAAFAREIERAGGDLGRHSSR